MQFGPSAPTVLLSKLLKTRGRGKRFIAIFGLVALGLGVMASLTSAKSPGRSLLSAVVNAVRGPASPPMRSNEGSRLLLPTAPRSVDHSVPLFFPNQESEPTVTTDKLDYQPGEFVLITGSGFWPNEIVTLEVDHADHTEPGGSGHEPWTVTADAFGQFFTSWFVDPDDSLGSRFVLSAVGASSNLSALTFFTDAGNPSGDLDQCGNGPASTPVPCTGTAWQNGNLNQNQAHYSEGDSVPYRLRFQNLDTTISHNVIIEWDTTKSGKHALDYLTSFDRTETTANPCSGVAGCVLAGPKDLFSIPVDSNVTAGQNGIDDAPPGSTGGDDIAQIAGNFTLFNGDITAVSVYTLSGTYAGDSSTRITITFTASTTNPVLAWGGHIATRVDWGLANSAIAIPGSPYHTRFIDLDGSGGNQDRSLSASAVFFPVSLTIIKETNPDTAAVKTFNYTVTGNNLTPFSLTPPDGLTPDQRVFSLTDGTTRTVTESDPAAASPKFDLTSLTCQQTNGGLGTGTVTPDAGTRTVTITPNEGESITCTYVNTQRGKIIVEKQTTPDAAAGNFTFTGDAAGTISDGGQIVVEDLSPGTYTSTENDPTPAFDLTDITCNDANSSGNVGTRTATFNVEAGETVKCTFTNTQRAKIIVKKETDPDGDPQSFSFTASYDNDGFSLSDGQENDSGSLVPGTYSVSETVPAGWDLESATCSDGSQPGSISLQAGETVTCTFTNEKDANIVVVKQTDPDGDPQSFSFTASYDNDGFSLSDGQQNNSGDLDPGTYSVSETVPAGWDLESATCSDGSQPGSISLQAGETVTCTFTNEKDAKIIVNKVTDPSGDPQSFEFDPSYGPNFFLTGGGSNNSGDLDPGTYSVAEIVPAGWDLTSASCVSSIDDTETPGNIELDAGETVTCTFNNQKDAKIIVKKRTDPAGDPQSFSFTASYDNDGFSLTDGQQNDSGDLDPGTYSVSETVPAGWDLTSSPCVSSKGHSETIGNISLQAGETVTCTFYNQKDAFIVVKKETDPDADPQSFNFTTNYSAGFSLSDGQQNNSGDINPGTYSVSETVPSGWDLTSSPCVSSNGNAETANNISLQAGETVTCTFNNRKRGKVEVLKITNGGVHPELDIRFTLYRDGPDADPDLTGTDTQLEELTTLGDADGLLQFAEKLVPGTTYTICENPVPAGWTSLWTIGFSVGGNIITPYNPNLNDPVPSDLGIRCVDFTVNPGQTKQFEVHNDFPGGDPRTIGYWKNWNRCTGGGQAANAAKNGGAAAGFFILEDLLPQLIGDFNVTNCQQGVFVLSKQDQAGRSKSSDAAYELAAQFLAARFNLAAGAETCPAVQAAVVSAQNLLDQINFTGSGDYLTSKQKNLATLRAQALSLATTLDRYNNGILCP